MKQVNYPGKKVTTGPYSSTKYKSHGSYRAKRKPNSPKVKS